MWVAHYSIWSPLQPLVSGLGTMGFGLPAAIGAKVARPENTVVAVCGDGLYDEYPELATLKR